MVADEGPAYGVALLAAVGDGAFKNITEACRTCVETAGETKPNSNARRRYDEGFPVYQGLYASLKADFQAIAALPSRDGTCPAGFIYYRGFVHHREHRGHREILKSSSGAHSDDVTTLLIKFYGIDWDTTSFR